jgi:hypothetical protein
VGEAQAGEDGRKPGEPAIEDAEETRDGNSAYISSDVVRDCCSGISLYQDSVQCTPSSASNSALRKEMLQPRSSIGDHVTSLDGGICSAEQRGIFNRGKWSIILIPLSPPEKEGAIHASTAGKDRV